MYPLLAQYFRYFKAVVVVVDVELSICSRKSCAGSLVCTPEAREQRS